MSQQYEPLVQEDLNVGTGMVFVTAPSGGEVRSTQIGLHSVARGQRAYEASWTPGAILTTGKTSTTVSVPDAAEGDFVLASHDQMLTTDLRILGHVSAAGVVTVVMHNPTGATVTVGAGTVSVIVFPFLTGAEPPSEFSVTWTVEESEGGISGESWTYYLTPVVVGGVEPYSFSWDMGDGEPPNTAESPTQVWQRGAFSNPDDITVTLTVTDDTSATADYADTVTVNFNE